MITDAQFDELAMDARSRAGFGFVATLYNSPAGRFAGAEQHDRIRDAQ